MSQFNVLPNILKIVKGPNAASELMNAIKSLKGFDKNLDKVTVKSIRDGRLIAEVTVQEEHTNPMGTLHGGFSTLLIDSCSGFALASHKNGDDPGFSVDLHLTFLKGANVGDTIEIDAETLKIGKSFAFQKITIKNKNTGDLLVKGHHTKYMIRKKA